MSSKTDLRQLRHRDPAQRKKAIKAAARSKDHSALKQLAKMAGDDPEPEIRELARKAGLYIRQQHGELGPQPAPDSASSESSSSDKDGKPPEIPISEKDAADSREHTNAALTYQMNDDKARACKELRRALALNPNLRYDAYFISLSEAIVGGQGDAVFQQLSDDNSLNDLAKTQTEVRRQREMQAHLERVQNAQWNGAIFDLGLFFLMAAIGAALLTFLAVQSAQGLVNQHDERQAAWRNAEVDEETGEPIEPMEVDADFLEYSHEVSELPFMRAIRNGLLVGVLATVSLLAWGALAHALASTVLGGTGTLPYLTHRWASMLNIRLLVTFVLGGIGIVAIFSLGGGSAVLVMAGVLGLIALLTLFAMLSLVAQSYNVSVVKGLVAVMVGALVVIGADAALILMTGLRLV